MTFLFLIFHTKLGAVDVISFILNSNNNVNTYYAVFSMSVRVQPCVHVLDSK